MAETQLYGKELLYGAVEILSHSYSSGYLALSDNALYNYNYTDKNAKSTIENILV